MNEAIPPLFRSRVSALARRRGFVALGRLGSHWIRGEVLAKLGVASGGRMPLERGEFIVLLHRAGPSEVVHEGLALPLRWRSGAEEDARLPRELAVLARAVARGGNAASIDAGESAVDRRNIEPRTATPREATPSTPAGPDARADAPPFTLWLGDGCPDLSEVSIPAASAGAMLRATLDAARDGLEIDDDVTATATWGGADLGPVDGLEAKLEAARRLGLPKVFVSKYQYPLPEAGTTRAVPLEGRGAHQQLHALLLALDAPPVAGALDARIAWYERHAGHPAERARAGEFFCQVLARPLAEARRACDPPIAGPTSVLVAIASGSAESAAFAACAHRPERVVLLRESGSEGATLAARARHALGLCMPGLRVDELELPPRGEDFGQYATELAARLREELGEEAGDGVWIDLTGGTTMMKLAALEAGRRCGWHLSCVDKRDDSERRVPLVRTNRIVEVVGTPRA